MDKGNRTGLFMVDEIKKNIFEHNIGGHICYSSDVQSRLRDIKHSDDLKGLRTAFATIGLQKTVGKAILSRIKKLESGVKS